MEILILSLGVVVFIFKIYSSLNYHESDQIKRMKNYDTQPIYQSKWKKYN